MTLSSSPRESLAAINLWYSIVLRTLILNSIKDEIIWCQGGAKFVSAVLFRHVFINSDILKLQHCFWMLKRAQYLIHLLGLAAVRPRALAPKRATISRLWLQKIKIRLHGNITFKTSVELIPNCGNYSSRHKFSTSKESLAHDTSQNCAEKYTISSNKCISKMLNKIEYLVPRAR